MQSPSFFGHKKSINLLPRDAFEVSALGVVLEWALVFGKWAVIVTQLIVMGAFLWRFTLDRQLTDLRKSITSDVAIVTSYAEIERDYSLAQKQVTQAKTVLAGQQSILALLNDVQRITPTDIWYDHMTVSPNDVTLTAYSGSLAGFGQFLSAAQHDPLYSGVRLDKVESSSSQGAQIQFNVTLTPKTTSAGGR